MAHNKYKLKDNHVVHFKGDHYTNANITDEVAQQMVNEVPGAADNFVNAPEAEKEEKEEKKSKKSKAKKEDKKGDADEANESMKPVEENPNIKE